MNTKQINIEDLTLLGLTTDTATTLYNKIIPIIKKMSGEAAWKIISTTILNNQYPFTLHKFLFSLCYPDWKTHPETAPAWIPEEKFIATTHLATLMAEQKITNISDFHSWTTQHHSAFIAKIIDKIKVIFQTPPTTICDMTLGKKNPLWLVNAKLNIIESCFKADPTKNALLFLDKQKNIATMSYGELNKLSNRIANSLINAGYIPGDAIGIDMPMTKEAVALYLGIIKMGGAVVSIADSFSAEEIATRLRMTQAKAVFTQDFIQRGNKQLPLYEKVAAANPNIIYVLPYDEKITCSLRNNDVTWENFLQTTDTLTAYPCDPMATCNILFSSGTTGEPKAIPWNHTTPIKVASDAYLHHDIKAEDILAWPTNLGWMMGPWLIFAALMNNATLALYTDAPNDRLFGEFIQNTKVTMLGIVPTLVATWRQSQCMQGLDWTSIKAFSSTGECSNPDDMLYLMSLANYKPIIEYCGGTEIGGSYITSTLIEKNYPALFTTPTMGVDFVLLDEEGKISDNGEVAILVPALGLSTQLLNADHDKIYFANMPNFKNQVLRRHGDQAQRLAKNCYCLLGRIDDTMNLGGIKISSAEIERALIGIEHITETAAIAVAPPQNGPSQLIIYAATTSNLDPEKIKQLMQTRINQRLNPLFKIQAVIFIPELPKTASNKIMRRVLRQQSSTSRGLSAGSSARR